MLEVSRKPFDRQTWLAAMTVVLERDGGDTARTRRLGPGRFEQAVRREITRAGGQKPCLRMVRAFFAALADPVGVTVHRVGALERVQFLLADFKYTQQRLAEVEARMVAVLDELALTELVTSIDGLSAVGAASILAQTGDLRRFTSGRALVKHTGLAPRENKSGELTGRTRLARRGRPALRAAAWRAVWAASHNNPVYAARLQHLTHRDTNRLKAPQARAVLAAALLRHLHAVVTTGRPWNALVATYGLKTVPVPTTPPTPAAVAA